MDILQIEEMVEWKQFGELEHFRYSILHIDDEQQRAEVLFKFEPHKPIILHRHTALNKILVLKGEHRIYDANGDLTEVRPAGSYKIVEPCEEPHSESGGEGGAIALFSIFDNGGNALYELMDEAKNVIASLHMSDLVDLYQN